MNGPEVKRLRLAARLTTTQLGAQAGCGEQTIVRAEAGLPVREITAMGIAAAFGISMRDITVPEPETLAS